MRRGREEESSSCFLCSTQTPQFPVQVKQIRGTDTQTDRLERVKGGDRARCRCSRKAGGALAKMSNEVSAGQPQIWTGCHNICHCFARPRFIAFPHTHTHTHKKIITTTTTATTTRENEWQWGMQMQRIVRILHILQLRLPSAASASASSSSPTAITHLVAGSREGSFCLILFLTSDCESATHFPLPSPPPSPSSKDNSSTWMCVCVSGICMYISANARAGSNFASACVGVDALPELCLLCNLLCNICNYYCNAANFFPLPSCSLFLSLSISSRLALPRAKKLAKSLWEAPSVRMLEMARRRRKGEEGATAAGEK